MEEREGVSVYIHYKQYSTGVITGRALLSLCF